jgi:hypothetical protein
VIDSRRKVREEVEAEGTDCSDHFPAFFARFSSYKYPEGFKLIGITKYDGKQAPQQWLHSYSTAIEFAGGSNITKVIYFPMALDPAPLTWLESLSNNSIDSWERLKKVFIDNFQGAIARAGTHHDLAQCKQEHNELLRSYTRRFFDVRATIANISEDDILEDLVVAEVRLTKVLIDGESGLNLIFASTLRKMGLDLSGMLVPSKSPFYGIIPGNAAHPLGTVVLRVTFGTRENYRTEFIKFEVANFESSYHAILGRPALAKFMAVPYYVYLLLKMPGLSGVLTLRGTLKKSYDCNQEAIQYASTTRVPDASGEVLAAAQQLSQSELEIPSKKASKSSIQSTDDVALKTIQLQEHDSSKTAIIGAGLGEK